MAVKTYVLEECMTPTAPIYIRVSKNQRVRIDKIPHFRPYLTYTYANEKGNQETIRLKLNSNSILLEEQIKQNIPANAKFTNAERDSVRFRNAVLVTGNQQVQKYLEATPEFNGFKGSHHSIKTPKYRLYDKVSEVLNENKAFRDNLKAANKIAGLNLRDAQDLLIKVYGTHFKVPKVSEELTEEAALAEAQNMLIAYMDTGDKAVAEIIKEEFTFDEEVSILIGRLIGDKKLSFDAIPDQVAKKKNDTWIPIKQISSVYPFEERKSQFISFLSTKEGFTLLADLKNESEVSTTVSKKSKKEESKLMET